MVSVRWSTDALKDIEKIDTVIAERIVERTQWLEKHFTQIVPKQLRRDLRGFFKLRVGDYRVIYSVSEDIITIIKVGHRRDVYR
ncbi:hypothetical protein A3A38_02320 [Candidatus Kaiserbacteria bacterium RIFCSPLOWO2_01_FULL_53_17]|uniref:Addiction module toxin RelE n=1 Tax=Candidatus Kaiserbacteria bacterium RIFCSPLOWO2_01_FULL_53_17 TaxID=1798511 RepID=A0A1F6EHU1_9BACT|nr:MAG: hypothetical protein A3A38_02320 [Candidatus Kaiserbacteria bacterium RIFCSPLOWO2_01_FULL_53_17]